MKSIDPLVIALQKWLEVFMRSNMRSFIQFSKENNLSMSQVGALFGIDKERGGVSLIGEHLGMSSAAASQLLQRLVEEGLVLRTEDPTDRRAKKMVLTEKGRRFIDDMIALRQDQLERLSASLSASETDQIIAAFKILSAKAIQLEQQSELEVR